jgi:thiamine pyrophosphokinase
MNIPLLQDFPTVIVADGAFPTGKDALRALHSAKRIVCCDGAVEPLVKIGLQPAAIVGDMDSISAAMQRKYAAILHPSAEQESNDLTKAVKYCITQELTAITIVGATGKREDHTIGNISLLAGYSQIVNIQCITDYGVFVAICQSSKFDSYAGQQVSLFSLNPTAKITSEGLKYPLHQRQLTSWWQGSLNEAIGDCFALEFNSANLLIYRGIA